MDNLEKLNSFLTLEDNWNDNGAEKFNEELINKCIFLEKFICFEHFISPTACNSIQFEFEINDRYLELEVFDDKIEVFISDLSEREYKFDNNIKGLIQVVNVIKYFHLKKFENIAVFTGAFNPPTKAHKHVIKRILEMNDMDLIVVALSNKRFLEKKQKKVNGVAFSEEDRLLMMLSMTAFNPKVLIYGIEDGYTFNILSNVKNGFSKSNIYFVAGSDKLGEIPRWGYGDKLLKDFGFIILTRNEEFNKIDCICKKLFKNYKILDSSTYENLSATKVRKAIENNSKYKNMVDDKVFEVLENIKKDYF